ncbi:MAG: ABC transporter ATP-binding protein [Xanthobacteraceae bacterium]|jgi:lipopolysaccharide transport system ATP-binding protein
MSCEPAIQVENVGKSYLIYQAPHDRLKQSIVPRLQRAFTPLARLAGRTIQPRLYYREFWALRDVSFEVAVGETVGIIGPNGSGKSTLLQLICGTLNPSTGRVQVRGRVGALLELGSGFNPEFTGLENVYMNGTVLGLTRAEIDARLDDILAFADIGDFIDQPVKTYSSGMGVRLAFAVMAHIDADVLIIDEALAVGDAFFQQKCMRWLRKFREHGTVLFCGHDTGAVTSLCHHAVWLDHGSMRAAGPAKDVCEAYMATVYARTTGLSDKSVRPAKRDPELKSTIDRKIDLSQIVEVLEFNENSASFGTGDAVILDARVLSLGGKELGLIRGGEEVQVIVKIRANVDIENPIVGFHVKDRLGQPLFGDNTYLQYSGSNLRVMAGETIEAKFVFELPFLRSGEYSVTAAIASGTLEHHVQHHWLHDSMIFKVHSPFRNGVMIAIPMRSITLEIEDVTVPEKVE